MANPSGRSTRNTQGKKMAIPDSRDSDDGQFIDLFELAKPEYRIERVVASRSHASPTPPLSSSHHPGLSEHSNSRKRNPPPVNTLNGPQKKPRVSKSRQPSSTMDSSSGLPGQQTPPSQGEAAGQLFSNPIDEPQTERQESAYTELRFEVDISTQPTDTSDNNFRNFTEQDASPSHPRTLSGEETEAMPDGFQQLYNEVKRLDAEKKQREKDKISEEERIAEEKKANEMEWPGDTSAYPAESLVFMSPPGSHLRAQAVHVGIPKGYPATARISAFAVRQVGSADIEFRVARDGSSPAEIRQGATVDYKYIQLNTFFKGMKQNQADLWARQLLAQVPGLNDALVKWK
ncbi:hypothetical protein F4774DRAFT_426407 [Daldinia eschscholtzii]|nr:hypothetical protein F4774DRAFT_426407 [Daldinia eschscholtzii]